MEDLEAQLRTRAGAAGCRRHRVLPHRARRACRPSSRPPTTVTSWPDVPRRAGRDRRLAARPRRDLRRRRRHPPQGRRGPRRARGRGRDRGAVGARRRRARIDAVAARLYAAHPGDARIVYELAGAHDAPATSRRPSPLYERPWPRGLREPHRHRAQLQLASSLRIVGRPDEAVRGHRRALARDGIRTASAVGGVPRPACTTTAGRGAEALADLLTAVAATSTATTTSSRYRRRCTAYAARAARPRLTDTQHVGRHADIAA